MANIFTANQYAPSESAASLLERMRLAEEQKRLLAEESSIEKWGQSKLSPVMGEQETFPEGTYYATMDTSATPRFKDSPIREFGYGLLTNLGLTTEGVGTTPTRICSGKTLILHPPKVCWEC